MKTDISNEQLFIADIEALDVIAQNVEPVLAAMESWRARCQSGLEASRLCWPCLQSHHPLAVQADMLNGAIDAGIDAWARQWVRLAPARALAQSLDDMVVLLVFGKFNAGKSSFCNLLADRFAAAGKTAEYFYLEAGAIVESQAALKEGVTETTSRVQGVRLAGKLVLVDTPGMHSVTPENAALTQLFTDSADAVLWLTSSTSPGQVQELDALGCELHRNKPLLPVLTRSDVYDEDEVDGQIVKVLRAKTPANRTIQETDVTLRARQKLEAMGVADSLLQAPVSVSSLLARQQGQGGRTLAEAGFEHLYAGLSAIVEPMLAYKRRKHAEMVLHHLEESVLGTLRNALTPLIAELRSAASVVLGALALQRDQLAEAVWRSVMPQLPQLLDSYAVSLDRTALRASVALAVRAAYAQQIGQRWADYQLVPCALEDSVDGLAACNQYDALDADIDYQALYAGLSAAIRTHALALGDSAAAQAREAICGLDLRAQLLEQLVVSCDAELVSFKSALRQ